MYSKYEEAVGLKEHKCHVCDKLFECTGEYAYKKYKARTKSTVFFCSYTCMRKFEKEEEKTKRKYLGY